MEVVGLPPGNGPPFLVAIRRRLISADCRIPREVFRAYESASRRYCLEGTQAEVEKRKIQEAPGASRHRPEIRQLVCERRAVDRDQRQGRAPHPLKPASVECASCDWQRRLPSHGAFVIRTTERSPAALPAGFAPRIAGKSADQS